MIIEKVLEYYSSKKFERTRYCNLYCNFILIFVINSEELQCQLERHHEEACLEMLKFFIQVPAVVVCKI